MTLVSGNINHL